MAYSTLLSFLVKSYDEIWLHEVEKKSRWMKRTRLTKYFIYWFINDDDDDDDDQRITLRSRLTRRSNLTNDDDEDDDDNEDDGDGDHDQTHCKDSLQEDHTDQDDSDDDDDDDTWSERLTTRSSCTGRTRLTNDDDNDDDDDDGDKVNNKVWPETHHEVQVVQEDQADQWVQLLHHLQQVPVDPAVLEVPAHLANLCFQDYQLGQCYRCNQTRR